MGDIMRAIGLSSLEDTDQLIGGQLEIKVKISPANNGYDASNDVSGFKALKGGAAPMAKAAPMQAASAPSAGAPPWAK